MVANMLCTNLFFSADCCGELPLVRVIILHTLITRYDNDHLDRSILELHRAFGGTQARHGLDRDWLPFRRYSNARCYRVLDGIGIAKGVYPLRSILFVAENDLRQQFARSRVEGAAAIFLHLHRRGRAPTWPSPTGKGSSRRPDARFIRARFRRSARQG